MYEADTARVYSDISPEFSRDHAIHLNKVFKFFTQYFSRSRGYVVEAYYTERPEKFKKIIEYCPTIFIPGARNLTACYFDVARWFIIPYQIPDFGTLQHEIGHDFLYATFPRSEEFSWFKEGLAMYFEGGRFDSSGDLVVSRPHNYCTYLYYRDANANALIPLNALLNTSKKDFLADNERTYSQSCMFIHYLTDQHPVVFNDIIRKINNQEISSNEDLLMVLVSGSELSIDELETGFRRYAGGPIEITQVGRGISVTSENQILVELEPSDIVPANPFDLAGRTLVFTPDGRGGYSRAVAPLDWDPEDRGARPGRPVEIELDHFQFDFSGRKWGSFFLSKTGLITFGKEFPSERTPARFGTMRMIADAMVVTPTISALYKPYLGGNIYVSDLPDMVVITFYAWDYALDVYGQRPKDTFDYQIVLHSDGRVAFNYGPDPSDRDEAIRDGIVGLFPIDLTTGVVPRIPDRLADLSRPDSRFSAVQTEVFRYAAIRDRGEGVADVSCRIIEVLGDEFDFFAFNSQSRVDIQESGPAHGFGGYYWGNIQAEVQGVGLRGNRTTPCESRLKNTWGFPVWMKARTVVNEDYANDGQHTPYDEGLTYFAHEIGHTWLAYASYLLNGERTPMQVESGVGHWALGLHAPAPFPWHGAENGSVMGGAFWRENLDGTFSPTVGWWTKAGGFSWLELYLMGLATPEEVPDMFILRNLEQLTSNREGPYAGEKEIVTIEQVIAAIGPRNPPSEEARKVFNIGFVYFLLTGQSPDPELLREHADYRDRALDHWSHVTGGRGKLTTELP